MIIKYIGYLFYVVIYDTVGIAFLLSITVTVAYWSMSMSVAVTWHCWSVLVTVRVCQCLSLLKSSINWYWTLWVRHEFTILAAAFLPLLFVVC